MIALLAIPLICIIGLGIDYGLSVRAEALLDSAADAAAVAATSTAANSANNANTSLAQIFADGQAAGTQMFNAQVANIPNVNNPSPVAVVTVSQPIAGSATFAATVAYTAGYSTWFGSMFNGFRSATLTGPNSPTFYLSGNSSAQITLRAYDDFHILMDTSGSMSIAATAADMSKLAALTMQASALSANNQAPYNTTYNKSNTYMPHASEGTGCAFGCHWETSNTNCQNCDFYEIAQNAGVKLRIDVEQTAVQQVISTMASQDSFNQYRAAVYGFSTQYTPSGNTYAITGNLTTVSPLPASQSIMGLTNAATAAQNMVQPIAGTEGHQYWAANWPQANTNFGAAMNSLIDLIPTPGDGTTAASPQQFLFVITDGIEDFCQSVSLSNNNNICNGRTIQPIQPSECAAIKAKGVQILVLYVQYVPLDVAPYSNLYYINDALPSGGVQSFIDPGGSVAAEATAPVVTNLQACSSPNNPLFIATDSTQIQTQLNAMLLAAENQGVRLTQ